MGIGNILFICGLSFIIGLERTYRFFLQWRKVKGTLSFFGGILIVLFGWPVLGMMLETYGFVVLFSGFFPVVINFLQRIPVIGSFFALPGVSRIFGVSSDDQYKSMI